MRSGLVGVVVVVACCAPPKQQPVAPSAPAPTPAAVTPVSSIAPAKSVVATPDEPKGDAREMEFAKLAAAYIDAFSNTSPLLTPGGTRVVFVSDRDGLPQLYIADAKPGSPATRVVATDQRVASPQLVSGGKAIVFRSDIGADENWSIFRVDLDGKNLLELTPGERLVRDEPVIVRGKTDTMFYSARSRAAPRSTLYAASLTAPGTATALFSEELPAFLEDIDSTATFALYRQQASRLDARLLRVELTSGTRTQLFPAEGAQATMFDAKLSPDGKLAYVATDAGGEVNVLLALDAKTGMQVATYRVSPPTAMITSIVVARSGRVVALNIVAGDHGELVLVDAKTLKQRRKIDLPLGTGAISAFTADGKRAIGHWSTPQSPPDLFTIEVATGEVSALRSEARPSLASLPRIAAALVDIAAFDGGKIPSIVHVPPGEQREPHPTIVAFHGGPAGVSAVRWDPMIAFFVSLGYAVIEPNIRGSAGFGRAFEAADNGRKRLDAFKDVEATARWAAQQPWADKSKLVPYGSSYGGYLVLIALSRWPELWRAGVELRAIVDLRTLMSTTGGTSAAIRAVEMQEFAADADVAFFAQISPLADVDKIRAPLFVYQGANDPRVPRNQSDEVVKALRARNLPVEYMVAPDEGHSLARRPNQLEFYSRVARFLEQHLR